ncbi:hypothetical protein [Mongoliitalea daihaiensis]|uniref:hypothetical protein n=1 Tax=Mongoliitalea daihaiensis TaxID=2782006 RepID=UPI001F22C23D|nr:hypothetical protein [Mongoliitalea daihaiensis]UJP63695.1 hypothetical protein IPZ59_12730 [Mongoliitalea daihaiensis]
MKKLKIIASSLLLIFGMGSMYSCDVAPTDALMEIIKEDLGFIPVIANFTLASPTASATAPTAGTNCTFDLRYWSEGEIDRVQFWVKLGTADPVLVDDRPYAPAFSNISKTDSLLINYTIPAALPVGTVVGMEARVTNKNLPNFPVTRTVNVTVR